METVLEDCPVHIIMNTITDTDNMVAQRDTEKNNFLVSVVFSHSTPKRKPKLALLSVLKS